MLSADIADMGNGIVCAWCYFVEGSPTANGCAFHLPFCAADPKTHGTFSIARRDAEPSKAMGCYINDHCSCISNCSAFVYGSMPPKEGDKPAVIINNVSLSCYAASANTEQNCEPY